MEALTRQEIVTILSTMNIDIPARTKLPDKALQKRLAEALEAAQYTSAVLPKGSASVNPSSLSAWSGGPLLEAVRRGDMNEAVRNMAARAAGKENVDLYEDAFIDLRQTIMSFGNAWDQGHKCFILQPKEGPEQVAAINIRILSVHSLNTKTPLITLLYDVFTRDRVNLAMKWINEHRETGISNVTCTPIEEKLLLKLLDTNAKLLSPDYKPQKGSAESSYKVSFILPVGPLTFQDVGRLNNDTGCVLCGKKQTSRCSQCQTISYCGLECQKAHWSDHKYTCRSLKGGTWRTYTFNLTVPGTEGMYGFSMNKFNLSPSDMASGIEQKKADGAPPPNLHGDKTFLVKIQKGNPMMVYDRQRSFEGYIGRGTQPTIFDELMAQMQTGYMGLKVYRWAKRTGDFELTVCFDRGPQQDPKW